MVFKCQQDSFLKEFTSNVVSCVKSDFDIVLEGKKTKIEGYEVVLEDTIIFPEGGGQPTDHGYLDDKKVFQVLRKGDKAIHYLNAPLDVGTTVNQKIDWDRRFDHMQQHSGQHLLSAVLERDYKFETVSWWLGEEDCYVELETPSITQEQINKTEKVINEYIREARNVKVNVFKKETPPEELKEFTSRKGLPDDHVGDIRVIVIDDIDQNMCCGTHVTNLAQLQCIKLLHWEKSKRKNQILLHFLVGQRVLKRLEGCVEREQKLTVLLNNGPQQHIDLVEKLQRNVKTTSKNLQMVLKDIVLFETEKLKKQDPKPKYFALHKKEAEPDFMNGFVREMGNCDIFLFLSTGDEKKEGNILMVGNEQDIAALGPKVGELLNGKGAGKGNRYQAKVTNMNNRKKVLAMLEEHFNKA